MTRTAVQKSLLALENVPVFSALHKSTLQKLLQDFSEIRQFQKDEILISPASTCKFFGLLLKGEARVQKDYVTVSVLQEGQSFGLAGLYTETSGFINTIQAKTSCRVLVIQKEGIDILLQSEPEFAKAYVSFLSNKIYFLNQKIMAYTAPSAQEKLLHYLQNISPENGKIENVSIAEITRQINVSRASLYRALDLLQKQGVLRYENKTILFL